MSDSQARSPMVEVGPEDGHPYVLHMAERRAEAVQQKLVRVGATARAAPEGAKQVQGLICKRQPSVSRLSCVQLRSTLDCRCHFPGTESCRAARACIVQSASLRGPCYQPLVYSFLCSVKGQADCQAAQKQRRKRKRRRRNALMPCCVRSSQVDDAWPLLTRLSSVLTFSDRAAWPHRPPKTSPSQA